MAFEVFVRKSAAKTKEPMITVQKKGNLSLNAAAYQLLAEGAEPSDPEERLHVELLFDPEEKIVGLRNSKGGPGEYPVRKQKNSSSYLVAGRAFTKFYDIDTSIARRYKAKKIDGILGFCLQDEAIEVGRKTARSKKPQLSAASNSNEAQATLTKTEGGLEGPDPRKWRE